MEGGTEIFRKINKVEMEVLPMQELSNILYVHVLPKSLVYIAQSISTMQIKYTNQQLNDTSPFSVGQKNLPFCSKQKEDLVILITFQG